jgi:hypothetical protein
MVTAVVMMEMIYDGVARPVRTDSLSNGERRPLYSARRVGRDVARLQKKPLLTKTLRHTNTKDP